MAYFKIIVTTRNRPNALKVTLLGIASLRYTKFSICVSDNSDSEFVDENENIVHEVLGGKDYKYIRPDQTLSMAEHWEFALDNAGEGDFFGIVTDRMTLIPNALEICKSALLQSKSEAICFESGTVSGTSGTEVAPIPKNLVARGMLSVDALEDFSKSRLRKDTPRFLNSFVSPTILDKIRNKYGKVFSGISPDYSFAFRFLDVCDQFVYVHAPILIDHSPHISNGMAITRNITNGAATDFLLRLHREQKKELSVGPLPFETTLLPNVILREMEIAKATAQLPHRLPKIAPEAFLISCAVASRRSVQLFDAHTRNIHRTLVKYRIEKNLPMLPLRIRLKTLAKAVQNTFIRRFSVLKGDSAQLPEISRDELGDLRFIKNLAGLAGSSVTFISGRWFGNCIVDRCAGVWCLLKSDDVARSGFKEAIREGLQTVRGGVLWQLLLEKSYLPQGKAIFWKGLFPVDKHTILKNGSKIQQAWPWLADDCAKLKNLSNQNFAGN